MAEYPTITELPPHPERGEPRDDFAAKANTFVAALPDFRNELNTAGSFVETKANEAATSASNAADSESAAAAAANAAPWDSGAEYSYPDTVIGSDGLTYRFVGGSPATGDDPTTSTTGNWQTLSYATPTTTTVGSVAIFADTEGRELGTAESDQAAARASLDVYSTGEVYTRSESDDRYLNEANNLSDLPNKATARTNLGVYSTAEAARAPTSRNSVSLGFDAWRTPNNSRPTLVEVVVNVKTDGTQAGVVFLEVDYGGGTVPDIDIKFATASSHPSGDNLDHTHTFVAPAGASYQIRNSGDPTGGNSIRYVTEYTL